MSLLEIDHILYAVPNLQDAISHFEETTGVCPIYGGHHPHLGTHNAIVTLGPSLYLEIIAADPESSIDRNHMIFDLGSIQTPRVITWACRTNDLAALSKIIALSPIKDGKRVTNQNELIQWKSASIESIQDSSGIVPFVMEWTTAAHPSEICEQRCKLLSFTAQHPSPSVFDPLLKNLSFDFEICESSCSQLLIEIETPKGIIQFS